MTGGQHSAKSGSSRVPRMCYSFFSSRPKRLTFMYSKHLAFEQPLNENEKVWRYMDFTKFTSFLDSGALCFTSAAKFEDPFEGSYFNMHL
jgi:hypothetical protein